MAQKTITSFFKAPQKLANVNKKEIKPLEEDSSDEDNQILVKRKTVRRISDSDDEKLSGKNDKSKTKVEEKKSSTGKVKPAPKTRKRKASAEKQAKNVKKRSKTPIKTVENNQNEDKEDSEDGKEMERSEDDEKIEKISSVNDKPVLKPRKTKEIVKNTTKILVNAKNNDITESEDENETKQAENDEINQKITPDNYNPNKIQYDPVKHACWIKGAKVPYAALAKTLSVIEDTKSRLKMIEILSNYFRSVIMLTPDDLLASIYLSLNQLAPAYEGLELGVGDMVVIKAVANTTGRSVSQLKAEIASKGDLGFVAESSRSNQRTMFEPARLTVDGVFKRLKEIAQMVGNTSMNKKTDKIQNLLVACRGCESRYIVRSLGGKLRIGLAEQSLLVALSHAVFYTTPENSEIKRNKDEIKKKMDEYTLILKTTYCECPNYDKITKVLLENGIYELPNQCKLTPAVAWDPEKKQIRPFQILSTRKRKDANESEIKVQVCIFAFDLLYLNGESLVKKPFRERRELLNQHLNQEIGKFDFAKSVDSNNTDEIAEFLEEAIRGNCEGLMIKTLETDASYEIAKRSRNWLKLKKDYLDGIGDTLDLVVIGGWYGKGKRTGTYGGFLLACYDDENGEYQTICKIGTGFKDPDLKMHNDFFSKHVIESAKNYYCYDDTLVPDVWFDSVQVWEVKCADLSISPVHKAAMGLVDENKGVSLRFPRFLKIREDKNPEDATTASQVADFYKNQEQIKNQEKVEKDDNEHD
uniref:DNA ligase 1 n=1 Tax=Strigamia maritima TaxID=126957 RepID=T1INI8_STRMM